MPERAGGVGVEPTYMKDLAGNITMLTFVPCIICARDEKTGLVTSETGKI